jgi:hypothetical protein
VPRPQTLGYHAFLDPYHRHSIYSSTMSISLFNMASEPPPPYTRPNHNLCLCKLGREACDTQRMGGIEEIRHPGHRWNACQPWAEGAAACGALSGADHLRQGQGQRLYQKVRHRGWRAPERPDAARGRRRKRGGTESHREDRK